MSLISNALLILARYNAKILDFGLANVSTPESATGNEPTLATAEVDPDHLTSPGTAVGTIAYMSPEQVRAKELTLALICSRSAQCSTRCVQARSHFEETLRA